MKPELYIKKLNFCNASILQSTKRHKGLKGLKGTDKGSPKKGELSLLTLFQDAAPQKERDQPRGTYNKQNGPPCSRNTFSRKKDLPLSQPEREGNTILLIG